MREVAILWEAIDPVVNRFVVRLVGEVARDQLLDHRDHRRDETLLGRGGKSIGPLDLERVDILEKRILERRGEFAQRKIRRAAAADRLVVDVGQVHHPFDREPALFEMPLEQILENVGAKISDVRVAVNRRPAGVHLDRASRRIERLEFLDLARVGVEETKRHPFF